MKFTFPLEKILKHKRSMEDMAKREWAEAQAQVDQGMQELNKMYSTIDEVRQMGSAREATGSARGFELSQVDSFIHGHKIRIEHHRQKLRVLMGKAEELHEKLVLAARERKTFEKLRETKFEEYKAMRKKMELKQMDELATTRFKGNTEE